MTVFFVRNVLKFQFKTVNWEFFPCLKVSSDKPLVESRTSRDSRAHIYENPVSETFSNAPCRNNPNSLLQIASESERTSVCHQSVSFTNIEVFFKMIFQNRKRN